MVWVQSISGRRRHLAIMLIPAAQNEFPGDYRPRVYQIDPGDL